MEDMENYLFTIPSQEHRACMRRVLGWVAQTFPDLEYRVLWNQPMFLAHQTFMIGFSVSQKHFSVSPESKAMARFSKEIEQAGYTQTKNLFRVGWSDSIPFGLLEKMIRFNLADKAECKTFWRK